MRQLLYTRPRPAKPDRTPCHRSLSNQLRLILHTAPYRLDTALHDAILLRIQLAGAEFATLKLRLFKADTRCLGKNIRIHFASACPGTPPCSASWSGVVPRQVPDRRGDVPRETRISPTPTNLNSSRPRSDDEKVRREHYLSHPRCHAVVPGRLYVRGAARCDPDGSGGARADTARRPAGCYGQSTWPRCA